MNHEEDFDRANDFASKALARMKKDAIAPLPRNFEVWYIYYASEHAQLKEEINSIIAEKGVLSAKDCHNIYQKFLSDRRHDDLFQKAGDHIHNTIQDVSGVMDNIRDATSKYSGTLVGVNQRLGSASTKEEMTAVINSVMQDTNEMLDQNRKLEAHLDQSAKIMKELKQDLEKVRREAMTDGLTGLTNRKSFDEKIEQTVEKANREHGLFTLLLLDIDHFKAFNDNYGHQVGDQVLRLVAKTLTDGVKGRDTTARYGGEEFAIILPDTGIQGGKMVAENLRKAIAIKEVINRSSGENLGKITISIGVAEFSEGESIADLIDRADAALYTAKHNGRNQVATAPTPQDTLKHA